MAAESIEDILAQLKKAPDPLDKLLEELDQPATPASNPPASNTSKADSPAPQSLSPAPEVAVLIAILQDLHQQKVEKAKAWLQNLDPLSADGIWFDAFAKHYPSPLEAAIALLGD
ncbi:MAG: salt stress protein, Slr1339 family [Pseudanabaenaceae cyanobacterium]